MTEEERERLKLAYTSNNKEAWVCWCLGAGLFGTDIALDLSWWAMVLGSLLHTLALMNWRLNVAIQERLQK